MILISNGGMIGIIIAAVLIIAIISIIAWYISTMNMLRQLEVKVEESLSGIDVALTKRFDLLTKMLATTKGYAKHEAETLENVIKWRSGIPQNATVSEKSEFASSLNQVAKGLNIVVEKYPDLKADGMFNNLQNTIADTEEHLQAARRLYNSNVSMINRKIVTFPISFVASKCNITKKDFFEAEENKKADPVMEF